MHLFNLSSDYEPAGDQQQAINDLLMGFKNGNKIETLMGVTGSGKTFTMAKIIEKIQQPVLVLSHNKTLAAQLYREFKSFFPENAVEYFVSYYDYYQPEAYVPSKDLYIEKDSSINDEIERLRLSAASSLIDRKDVIVVSTVSSIYGIGNPDNFRDMRISLRVGKELNPSSFASQMVRLQYKRNAIALERGSFRIRGDSIEIFPAYMQQAYRITLDWETIESIILFDPLTQEVLSDEDFIIISPANHFVMPEEEVHKALDSIRKEMEMQFSFFQQNGKVLEAQRIKTRTEYDLEMMEEMGFCSGIENYSRQLDGRKPGQRPAVLIDYFPDDYLIIIDESHVTVPQIGGMYAGDRSRKQNLVDFGFRLPSALDNRPLLIDEFNQIADKLLYVSATPSKEEFMRSELVVEQIIRPTGLVDPEIEVRPSEGQIEHLYAQILERIKQNERVLITTLTKKMSESLSEYMQNIGIKCRYMHSEIETIERVEILKELRMGKIDVLIGINLLREGLDLPEVSLVAILDADKIGFLRSTTSLIQNIGRAARNVNGKVIMYADHYSNAMKQAIDETSRRRKIQIAYNEKYGIEPKTIIKKIDDILSRDKKDDIDKDYSIENIKTQYNLMDSSEKRKMLNKMKILMEKFALDLEFEKAAEVRDEMNRLS